MCKWLVSEDLLHLRIKLCLSSDEVACVHVQSVQSVSSLLLQCLCSRLDSGSHLGNTSSALWIWKLAMLECAHSLGDGWVGEAIGLALWSVAALVAVLRLCGGDLCNSVVLDVLALAESNQTLAEVVTAGLCHAALPCRVLVWCVGNGVPGLWFWRDSLEVFLGGLVSGADWEEVTRRWENTLDVLVGALVALRRLWDLDERWVLWADCAGSGGRAESSNGEVGALASCQRAHRGGGK